MRGLPASGKSTRAKEIMAQSGNMVRINKDLLRKMLHFNRWTGVNERITRGVARAIVKELASNKAGGVIIDDTNLSQGTYQSWLDLAKELGASVQTITMDTPIDECLRRDREREDSVGDHVIYEMALKADLYKPAKGFVICDFDGTLADIMHRVHNVNKKVCCSVCKGEACKNSHCICHDKNWKAFFADIEKDKPRTDVMQMIVDYNAQGYDVFIVSGRPDDTREASQAWLDRFIDRSVYKALIMRKAGDRRDDVIVKGEIFDQLFKDPAKVITCIDDRPKVIRMWREKGLSVTDVGSGFEF